jgi:hypothetical protein
MKIHCAQLVEGALRSALEPENTKPTEATAPKPTGGSLLDSFTKPKSDGAKINFLPE